MFFKIKFTLAFAGLMFLSADAIADFLIDRSFSFGKIAVTNNNTVSSVQMSRSGRVAATGHIYILEIGQPGVYTLTDLPPFSVVSVTTNLPAYSSSTIPGTQQFTISSLDISDTLNVNESGTVQFEMGGVLQTSGAGGTYVGPAAYEILLNIDINY
jgi:hypothetical protein